MERRTFLTGLGASFGAFPFLRTVARGAGTRLQQLAEDVAAANDPTSLWRRVRQEFQLHPGFTHLNCGSLGATPPLIVDAVAGVQRAIEGDPAGRVFGWGGEEMERVRARAAAFIGANLDEVAFTRNTTEGMNAVAGGLGLKSGDRVLTSNHEHGGGMVCWQHLRRHHGVAIEYFEMPRRARSQSQLYDLVRVHLTAGTRVVSLSDIDTITGVRLPLKEIALVTRELDVLLVCDGAQAPGMVPVDVHELGVDTYALSGHKWMLGPKGSGMLYVRREVQDRVQPMLLHEGYGSYTASTGTRNVAGIVGLLATMDFHAAIGRERVVARCRELSLNLRAQLEEIPEVQTFTPPNPELSGALVTCALRRGDASEVVRRLRDEHQILVKRVQQTFAYCAEDDLAREDYNAIRFSTHIFNDEAEIDRAVAALRGMVAGSAR
jgi:selenocysteine lyase/cysteine desulfurase